MLIEDEDVSKPHFDRIYARPGVSILDKIETTTVLQDVGLNCLLFSYFLKFGYSRSCDFNGLPTIITATAFMGE